MNHKILVGCPTSDYHEYCLKEYLEAVKALTYPNVDLLLVDNSKTSHYYKKLKNLKINVIKDKYRENARERIVSSRNILRQYCLDNNYDYLFSLEQDVIPPINIIELLLKHKKDIVSAVYYTFQAQNNKTKLMPLIWTQVPGKPKNIMHHATNKEISSNSLIEAVATGLGCILINKRVLETVKFRFTLGKKAFDDHHFALDSRNKGFKIYADTSIKCKHLIKNRTWKWQDLLKEGPMV